MIDMTSKTKRKQAEIARTAGFGWAEEKAEALQGEVPAVDWPDFWDPEWARTLPFRSGEVGEHDVETLRAIANHAAAERWAELVSERREMEDAADEEIDAEANAVRLFETVQDSLPQGLHLRREGERVCLLDAAGIERTITSLAQAWHVIDEWKERRSL